MPVVLGGSITGIASAAGELWAVTDNGHVFRRADAGFGELTVTAFASLSDVYVAPDGAVFLSSSGKTLRWCLSNCNSVAAFSSYDVPNIGATLDALCGRSSTDVYAIADRDQAIGILFHWDGVSWTQLSNNLGVVFPRDCFMRPDGVLFISGTKDIVRWEANAAITETAGLDLSSFGTDATSEVWYGLHSAGGKMVAVGQKRRAIIRDNATSTWSIMANPLNAFTTFNDVGMLYQDEIYAAGSTSSPHLYSSDGGAFNPTAIDLPAISTVNNITVVSPNELYFGGNDNNGPVIIRGKR